MPIVSVVVPVYNVAQYIEQALTSVLSQTFLDFEIVVVDDGSTDETYELVELIAKRDARVRLFRNERNMKIAETLNKGVASARGDFIARFDGDDIMPPDRLQRQLSYILSHPEIGVVGCSYDCIDENGIHVKSVHLPSDYRTIAKLIRFGSPVAHNWMARREIYRKIGDYRFASVEDYDFLCRCILSGVNVANIPNYCGNFLRLRGGNTVDTYGRSQALLWFYVRSLHFSGQADTGNPVLKADSIMTLANTSIASRIDRYSDQLLKYARQKRGIQRLPLQALAILISVTKLRRLALRVAYEVALVYEQRKLGTRR